MPASDHLALHQSQQIHVLSVDMNSAQDVGVIMHQIQLNGPYSNPPFHAEYFGKRTAAVRMHFQWDYLDTPGQRDPIADNFLCRQDFFECHM